MPTLAEIRAVPKVLLHDHLDGGLRPQTVLELARETGYHDLPGDNTEELTQRLTEGAHRGAPGGAGRARRPPRAAGPGPRGRRGGGGAGLCGGARGGDE